MKILYVHNYYEVDLYRVKAFSAIKKVAVEVDIIFNFRKGYKRSLRDKFLNRLKFHTDPCKLNKRLLIKSNEFKPDVIFLVKGTNILPSTLLKLKNMDIKLISWSNDDMYAWHNRSIYYTRGLKIYDLIVTQKSYNCNMNELPALGAKKILFQNKAVDSEILNYKLDCSKNKVSHDVLFIGTYEKYRLNILLFLAQNNIKIHIYGWAKKMKNIHTNLIFHHEHLYGEDYVAAFQCSKINLNFLRKKNRDLQTSRSIEIPASKGFMLTERTEEHKSLFKEDKEATYFSDKYELLDKIIYYIEHDTKRKQIALNGYKRCLKDNYTFDNRIKEILNNLA